MKEAKKKDEATLNKIIEGLKTEEDEDVEGQLIYEILAKAYNILLELCRNSTNYSEFLANQIEELGKMIIQLKSAVHK